MRFAPALFAIATAALIAPAALAFSQRAGPAGEGTPMGHEYITVRSALEVLRASTGWKKGPSKSGAKAAKIAVPAQIAHDIMTNTVDDKVYGALYDPVLSAVIGQRWVDIAGTDVKEAYELGFSGLGPNCFLGISQDPDELQYDHFLRARQDPGAKGAFKAIAESTRRFKQYFVEAAEQHDGAARIKVRDGGLTVKVVDVDRHYFLLGRALHLFEDSFSPEHGVRSKSDGWRKVRGIKTFVCTANSDAHTNSPPLSVAKSFTHDGDIIWKSPSDQIHGAWTVPDSGITTEALAAVEATKDVWAAFLRVMALPREKRKAAAGKEADAIVKTWLTPDQKAVEARYFMGKTVAGVKLIKFGDEQMACDAGHVKPGPITLPEKSHAVRVACVSNLRQAEVGGDRDPHMFGIPYNWAPVESFRKLVVKVRGHAIDPSNGKPK